MATIARAQITLASIRDAVSSYTFFRYSDDGGQTFTAAKPWVETGEYGNGRNLYLGNRAYEWNGEVYQRGFSIPDGVDASMNGKKITVSAYLEGENIEDTKYFFYKIDLYFEFADGTGLWSGFNRNALGDPGMPGRRLVKTIDLSGKELTAVNRVKMTIGTTASGAVNPSLHFLIKDVKIEIGDTATEYTPAPEDQQFGLTPGAWLGVAVWDKPYPPMETSAYSWSKVKGKDGKPAGGFKGIAQGAFLSGRVYVDSQLVYSYQDWEDLLHYLYDQREELPEFYPGYRYLVYFENPAPANCVVIEYDQDNQPVIKIPEEGDTYLLEMDEASGILFHDPSVDENTLLGHNFSVLTELEEVNPGEYQSVTKWRDLGKLNGTNGTDAEFYKLRAVNEKAQVDINGKLTVNLSYQIEHIVGASVSTINSSAKYRVYYKGDNGTPAESYMPYSSAPSATYVLENYSQVAHPDFIVVELKSYNGHLYDRRTVPVTFSAAAALDINGQVGEISARVQGMAGGGRNMLRGTAFDREHPDWFELRGGAPIWPSVKHGGHNSVDCSLTGMTEDMRKGAFFRAEVEPGKKYTASVWSHGNPASFDQDAVIEVSYAADTQGGRTILTTESIRPSEVNVWQRFHKTFTVPQGVYTIEVGFFVIRNGGLQIAEPMLTSGNMLSDWQPAPEDAEAYLAEIKESIGQITLAVGNMRTGLEIAGIHLNAEETPHIRIVGDNLGFYGTDGMLYISIGTDETGIPYFRFFDRYGVEKYNLGYTGLVQLLSNARPWSWVASSVCGPLIPGMRVFASDLWNDFESHNGISAFTAHRGDRYWYQEGYTTGGDGTKIWTFGGIYDGTVYEQRTVESTDTPRPTGTPAEEGWYLLAWEYSKDDPNHRSVLIGYIDETDGKSAWKGSYKRIKVERRVAEDGTTTYLASINEGAYTEALILPAEPA